MTLQQLKYAITVAQTGTITEAAEKLYISQPSLTNAIHELDKTGRTSGDAGAEPFGDENDIRSYALDAVNTLKAEKIVNGDQNNNFNPLANTTRAEAAVIIYNVLSK